MAVSIKWWLPYDMVHLKIIIFKQVTASYITPRHVQIDSGMWKSDICANTFLHFWPPYPRAMLSFVSAASFKTWSMRAFLFLVSSIRTGLASGRFWTNRWIRTQLNQLFTTFHYNIGCNIKSSYYFYNILHGCVIHDEDKNNMWYC